MLSFFKQIYKLPPAGIACMTIYMAKCTQLVKEKE